LNGIFVDVEKRLTIKGTRMKRFVLVICCSIIFVVSLFGQAATSTWALTTNQTAVTTGNIASADQLLTNMQASYSSSVQRSSPTGTAGTWPAESVENAARYMQFSVSPNPAYNFTVDSVALYLYVNSGSSMKANVYYSTDSTFVVKTQIGTTFSLSSTAPSVPNVIGVPNLLVNDGQAFYLRIYPWYTSTTTGKYVIAKSVVISGTTQSTIAVLTSVDQLTGFVQQSSSTPSGVQTYTMNGTNLTSNVIVTPPSGFEISTDGGTNWNSSTSPVSLPVSGGVITGQPITMNVRLNAPTAGLYSGIITHTSTGAPETDIAISGVQLALEPNTISTLSFSNVTGSSMAIGFTGGNGNNRIVVVRPGSLVNWVPTDGSPVGGVDNNFTSATDQGNGNKVVYNGSGTSVNVSGLSSNVQYYVSVFEYNTATGNSQNYFTTTSANGTQTTLTVSTLSVSKASLSFGSVLVDATSTELTYVLSGVYLSPDAGNITVTAPSGFEISIASGSGFASSLLIPYSGSTLSAATIYVHFIPTALADYSGSLSHNGGSAPEAIVAVSGTGVSESALANTPIGYASCNTGTTGGTGGTATTVTTLAELEAFAAACEDNTTPKILYISGKISAPSTTVVTIKHGANISIYGEGSTGELENVGFKIWDYQNVIVRNLKIHEVFYPNDALTIDECQYVWIDHNELYSKIGAGIGVDTYDGLLDIKNGSCYVTVSWNYLHHHMKCSLIGHTDNTGQQTLDSQMRITYHHNWFSYTDGRNPSIRFGAIHMFNNYFEEITDYGIAARDGAHAKIENCHYNNVVLPMSTDKFPVTGLPNGYICESGNIFTGTSGVNVISQTGCDFWNSTTLPYTYTLDPVETVEGTVKHLAGINIALPVQMTSFTAELQGTTAILTWATATETNNAGFQIERSVEGTGIWIEVVFIPGAGTSNLPRTYSYEDKNLAPGAYIYRIKQIDNDGTTTIYNPGKLPKVDAGVSNAMQLCGNYPNPFNPVTTIQFSVPQDGHASLKVYNMLGQEVAILFSGIAKSGHYIPVKFDGSRYASGIYFARLQYNGRNLVQRMLMTK
jgi:pectate lyase